MVANHVLSQLSYRPGFALATAAAVGRRWRWNVSGWKIPVRQVNPMQKLELPARALFWQQEAGGSAALTCGKALPFRPAPTRILFFRRGCASPVEAQPQPAGIVTLGPTGRRAFRKQGSSAATLLRLLLRFLTELCTNWGWASKGRTYQC